MVSDNPYGHHHRKRREKVLTADAVCHQCGRPATQADHVPPLKLHEHVEGSGCCTLLPACKPCQDRQGGKLRSHVKPPPPPLPDEAPPTAGVDSELWDRPWLFDLLDVPADASWPRYMTAPHPEAVGSYGAEAMDWLSLHASLDLRWWQALALTRQLEHDEAGRLVWMEVLLTTARQVGKSILLRAGAMWRLHQAGRFGEEQLIMHTGKDVGVCKEIHRPARQWAQERGYKTFESNGNVEIQEPHGSRWLVRSQKGMYGYSSSAAIVDEAWGVDPTVIEDGLEPTMAERLSPQMIVASTGHMRSTSMFPARRLAAIEQSTAPDSTLLLEWSAPRDTDPADRDQWRRASPHWSRQRERLLEKQLARVESGESVDPDESDPVASFRAQYLNVWPTRTSTDKGTVLIPDWSWPATGALDTRDARVFVAVEDNHGRGAAVAAVAKGTDGRYEIDGWLVDSWQEAVADVVGMYATRERTELMIGGSLANEIDGQFRVKVATAGDTRAGLALLRQMVATGQLVRDDAPDLEQLTQVHVRELPSGMTLVPGHRADLVRASAWALLAAHTSQPNPAIG